MNGRENIEKTGKLQAVFSRSQASICWNFKVSRFCVIPVVIVNYNKLHRFQHLLLARLVPKKFLCNLLVIDNILFSVSSVRGKNTVQEQVLVQGNQISHVAKVLGKYPYLNAIR